MNIQFDSLKKKLLDRADLLSRSFNSKHKTVFVDKGYDNLFFPKNEKINIILSPAFYWVKKEKVAVKYEYQAKNFAPSIFEGTIPEGEYNYIALKHGNDGEFLFFAYNDNEIIEELNKLHIKAFQINYVFFAQNEFKSFEEPIILENKKALVNQDGIITSIPKSIIKSGIDIDYVMKNISLSKHKISISRFNMLLDQKSLNKISAVLVLFIVASLVELKMLKDEQNRLEGSRASIYKKFDLPTTTFQIDAIEKKLINRADEQKNLRLILKNISEVKLANGEHINLLELNKDTLKLAIALKDAKDAEKIRNTLSKSVDFKSIKVVDNVMHAEIRI